MTGGLGGPALRFVAGLAVAVALVFALVGVAILPFFNPAWLGFEQDRANVTGITGWSREEVRAVTDGVLHDLAIGPPDFAMTVRGQPVFDERERGHERDVRTVFAEFALAAVAGLAVLAVARIASRGAAWYWRAVAAGGGVVAGAVVLLGLFFGLAFDAAFELFHRLLFPAGSYSFDVGSERLVQLLPEQLWFETSIAFGVVLFALAAGVTAYALRRIRLATAEAVDGAAVGGGAADGPKAAER